MDDCPLFDKCNAPLCPLDENSIINGIWYPDEEVCKKKAIELWVKNQRKVKKRSRDTEKYFTASMLNRNIRVRNGITGLGTDSNLDDEKKWIEKHPEIRELSEKEKNVLRERFKNNILLRSQP